MILPSIPMSCAGLTLHIVPTQRSAVLGRYSVMEHHDLIPNIVLMRASLRGWRGRG